jgi:hypothetical protein
VSAASADWPKSLTLATGSPGGMYYLYGKELAKILTEKLGIAVNPLPIQGTIHNVKLLYTQRSPTWDDNDRRRSAILERYRRLERRKANARHARAVSNV